MCAQKYSLDCSRRRPISSSYTESIYSIAGLHTEVINIWSHLLSTVLFSSSAVRFAATCTFPLAPDAIVIYVYLAAAAFCFLCSTLYHIFADHASAYTWQRIDHLGIVIFIWATSISFIYLSFHGEKNKQLAGMIVVNVAAVVSLICLWRIFSRHSRSQRNGATVHITFGGLAALLLPGLHYWYHWSDVYRGFKLLKAFWALVILNSIGGGIYVTKLLDKTVGKRLNMPDVSHHVMHFIVVIGAWIYQQGLFFEYHISQLESRSLGMNGKSILG